MNTDAFVIPDEPMVYETVRLSSSISAIELLPTENGRPRLGLLSRLPAGAMLQICGDGFDERTAKVCVSGQYYFVFLQEIESARVRTVVAGTSRATRVVSIVLGAGPARKFAG
jgi:hypothetical protein